jgi:hypothetical protein
MVRPPQRGPPTGGGAHVRAKHEPVLSFDRSSPVLAYWLAHCEGFGVRMPGGRRGYVEAVAFHSPDQPRVLALRMGLLQRRRLVPVELVEGVVPAKRLLLVGRPQTRARRIAAAGGLHARRFVTTAPPTVARVLVVVGREGAAALQRLLLFLAAVALALGRGAGRVGRAGGSVLAWAAPFVRRGAISTAWTFRLAAINGAALIRRGTARAALAARAGGRRTREGIARFREAAAPRARAGAGQAVRAAESVNTRLEGPLLRLHERFASANGHADGKGPGPLLPRSFKPPARSGHRRDSPTPSRIRRSS